MLANINVKTFVLFHIDLDWIDLDLFRSFYKQTLF